MNTLSPDVWVLVGLHLKPRYLAKLMRTSKTVKKLVDNETYWTRVAAHLLWRNCDCMEIYTSAEDFDVLPRIDHNLYYMLGLDHGYYWGMERLFQRMDEVIEYYSLPVNSPEGDHKWWENLKCMTLAEKTREWMKEGEKTSGRKWTSEELRMSMKEVIRTETVASLSIHDDKMYNKFLCDIEDEQMPTAHKRIIMRKLKTMLWGIWNANVLNSPDSYYCPTDIAQSICRF